MPPKPVLSPRLTQQRALLCEILDGVISLAQTAQEQASLETLRERRRTLESAALFVVVGEVKAGKSSFINALLGEEICKVAPDPCTAVIEELVYGEERSITPLGDYSQRVRLPKEVLKEITIVDTPGTNSIIRNHHAITENYIPQSDLVIFVFSAKNPHTASAWELLSHIRREWHRKVVFVLQQADLASQHELSVNRERVVQYARERNVQNVLVFSVSATREQEGASDSGFKEFRDFLRKAVENGDVWQIKFEGTRDTVRKILAKILEKLCKSEAALADDRAFYQGLLTRVAFRREKAQSLKRLVVDNLCGTYDSLTHQLQEDFREGLAMGKIVRRSLPLVRDKDLKTWLKELQSDFEEKASTRIQSDSQQASKDLADEIQAMIEDLTREIRHRQEALEKEIGNLAYDRSDLLERLSGKLHGLRIADIVGKAGLQGSDLASLTLAGGGIAAVGAAVALATKLAMFDITGGVLAAAGAALVAVTLLWKRRSIIADLNAKLAQAREDFRARLDHEITRIYEHLFHEIEHSLAEPTRRIEQELASLKSLADEARNLTDKAASLT